MLLLLQWKRHHHELLVQLIQKMHIPSLYHIALKHIRMITAIYVCWLSRPTFRFTMQEFSIGAVTWSTSKTTKLSNFGGWRLLGMGTCLGQAPRYLASKVRTHLSMTSFAAFFAGSIKFAYYKKRMLQKLGFLAQYSFPYHRAGLDKA